MPHSSTFLRVGVWFREERIPLIHEQLLKEMDFRLISFILIDSAALRSSLYDSQTNWEKSTRYRSYKRYKAHIYSIPKSFILSNVFITANVQDSQTEVLLQSFLHEFKWKKNGSRGMIHGIF